MKYLVTADIATEQYSSCMYLYGIFDTQEEALQFIKNWKPKKKDKKDWGHDNPLCFDFLKYAKNWISAEQSLSDYLIHTYIEEFDDKPICLAAHYE